MTEKKLTDILIEEKVKSYGLKLHSLSAYSHLIKEMQLQLFKSVELVADQGQFTQDLERELQTLSSAAKVIVDSLDFGLNRGQQLLKSILVKQGQIDVLKNQIHEDSSEAERLKGEYQRLETEKQGLIEELEKTQIAQHKSHTDYLKIKSEYDVLSEALSRQVAELSVHQQRLNCKLKQTADFEQQILSIKESIKLTKDHVRNVDLEDQASLAKLSELQTAIDRLKREYVALNHVLKGYESKLIQNNERILDQQNKIKGIQQAIAEISAESEDLARQIVAQDAEQLRNQQQMLLLENDYSSKKNELVKKQQEIRRNRQSIQDQEKSIESRLKLIHLLDGQIAEESTEKNILDVSLRNNKKSIVALKRKISENEKNYRELCQRVELGRRVVVMQKGCIEKSRIRHQELDQLLIQRKFEAADLDKELTRLASCSNEKKQIVSRLEQDYKNASDRCSALEQEKAKLESALATLNLQHQQLVELNSSKGKLVEEFETLVSSKQQKIRDLHFEIVDMAKVKQALVQQIDEMTIVSSKLELEATRLEHEKLLSENHYFDLLNQLSLLDLQIRQSDQVRVDYAAMGDDLHKKVEALKTELSEKTEQLKYLSLQEHSLLKDQQHQQALMKSLSASIDVVDAEIRTESSTNELLQRENQQIEELIGEQNETLLRYKAQLSNLLGENSVLQRRLDASQAQMETTHQQVESVSNEISVLQQQQHFIVHADLQKGINSLKSLLHKGARFNLLSDDPNKKMVRITNIHLAPFVFKNVLKQYNVHFPQWRLSEIKIALDAQKMVVGAQFYLEVNDQALHGDNTLNQLSA